MSDMDQGGRTVLAEEISSKTAAQVGSYFDSRDVWNGSSVCRRR